MSEEEQYRVQIMRMTAANMHPVITGAIAAYGIPRDNIEQGMLARNIIEMSETLAKEYLSHVNAGK